MTKVVLISGFLILFFSCSKEKDEETSPIRCNKLLEEICKISSSKDISSNGDVYEEIMTYDSIGNLTSKNTFLNGIPLYIYTNYEHDQFTNATKWEVYDTIGDLLTTFSNTYVDYEKPLVLTYIDNNAPTFIIRQEFTYDANGNFSNSKHFSNDMLFEETKNTKSDACGNLTYYESFLNGELNAEIGRITYYDYNKRLVAKFEKDGSTYTESYTYNNKGWESDQKIYYDKEFRGGKNNYTYDFQGNVSYYEKYGADGSIYSKNSRTYLCFKKGF